MKIPDKVFKKVKDNYGRFFCDCGNIPVEKSAKDALSLKKPENELKIIKKYLPDGKLEGKKILNIGSGFGIFNLVAIKKYKMDAYGVEPGGVGYEDSFSISREIFKENNLNKKKIINGVGEKLPFKNNTFDIVFSTNVLEHVQDPAKVIEESIRVAKPGGLVQHVYPNYHSYFDGHYAVFHPPVCFKLFFPWYVKTFFKKDPEFAWTLNTQLNIFWTKKVLKILGKRYNFKVLSLGEEIFFDRMKNLNFETWAGLTKVKKILEFMKKLKVNEFAARVIYFAGGWTPIILTIKKLGFEQN